jgi:hypothetical protein
MTYPAPQARRTVTVDIPAKMHSGMQAAATARGISTTAYARTLLEAAYSASLTETGDRSLDATVSAALILYGSGMDTEAIGRALKCQEHTVEAIIHTFQTEMKAAA